MAGVCRSFIERQQMFPPLEGQLSFAAGFIPLQLTPERLPDSHREWDLLVQELPSLFGSPRARGRIATMPLLDAEPSSLSETSLTRAAVVLSALAHAYWRFGSEHFFPQRITEIPSELPASLAVPWRSVARRLGRYEPERPFQNFYDLFLANYRLRPGSASDAARIVENLEVLVATFRNEAERVFYMSFVEMHYQLTPLLGAVCMIEEAVLRDDVRGVVSALAEIQQALEHATAVWHKISAREGSRVFCDPVLWSKTAAILGVPPDGMPQGATSGACAPMLHVLDALLGRTSYASHYGQFLSNRARAFVPRPVLEFGDLAAGIGLASYVDARAHSSAELREGFDAVVEAYSGKRGWLGRHTAKVFNYLCISTITGRNASVSGDQRYFSKQTWIEASAELHESRVERASSGCPMEHRHVASVAEPRRVPAPPTIRELPTFSRLEVARHFGDGDLWLILDDLVYDVSPYLEKHPGGMPILRAYAGQDATKVFWAQEFHDTPAVRALLARMLIGRVGSEPALDDTFYEVLCALIRCHQSSRMQFEHSMEGNLGLKLASDENAHMLLLEENLPAIYESLVPGGWGEIASSPAAVAVRADAQRLGRELDFRVVTPELVDAVTRRSTELRDADLTLIQRLLDAVHDGAATREPHEGVAARMRRELMEYFRALGAAVQR
jgi:cytochrome b involved in lipid metabolism